MLLGFLLQAGVEPLPAIVIQALAYTLATRTGAEAGTATCCCSASRSA